MREGEIIILKTFYGNGPEFVRYHFYAQKGNGEELFMKCTCKPEGFCQVPVDNILPLNRPSTAVIREEDTWVTENDVCILQRFQMSWNNYYRTVWETTGTVEGGCKDNPDCPHRSTVIHERDRWVAEKHRCTLKRFTTHRNDHNHTVWETEDTIKGGCDDNPDCQHKPAHRNPIKSLFYYPYGILW